MDWLRARTVVAWTMLGGSIIGWPVSALTVFRGEPRGILGLSWLAIILSAGELLTSSQVHEEAAAGPDRRAWSAARVSQPRRPRRPRRLTR